MKTWAPVQQRPDITMDMVDRFLVQMYGGSRGDFVHSFTGEAVCSSQKLALMMPDDSPPHPHVTAMECAMLAPKSELTQFFWKEPKERIPLPARQLRSFLQAHRG
jgi:hypothetical protein